MGIPAGTTGMVIPAYHPMHPSVDHATKDWIYKDAHLAIMYLVLRDQFSHCYLAITSSTLHFTVHLQDNPNYK